MSGRDHNESVNGLAFEFCVIELVQSIHEYVDTLVLPLITPADTHQGNIFRDDFSAHRRGYGEQFLTRSFSCSRKIGIGCRSKTRFEAVRSDYINLSSEETFTFQGGDVTYCSEYVTILSGFLFKRMSRHNVETPCHLIRIV